MSKSNSKAEDAERAKQSKGRVDLTHGGELVEAISPDDLVSVHDSSCQHKQLVRDPSETDFNAFICANPNCSEVFLYDKE